MASIMELSRDANDLSERISRLGSLNLETVRGREKREAALRALRSGLVHARDELDRAMEEAEIRKVRNIFSELPS